MSANGMGQRFYSKRIHYGGGTSLVLNFFCKISHTLAQDQAIVTKINTKMV